MYNEIMIVFYRPSARDVTIIGGTRSSHTECQHAHSCAVYCSNRFSKGCGLHFYRFPADPDRRNLWVAAVNRKNWQPSPYTWICSSHFIGGAKSDDPTSPSYSPSIFAHLSSCKRQGESQLARYNHDVNYVIAEGLYIQMSESSSVLSCDISVLITFWYQFLLSFSFDVIYLTEAPNRCAHACG